MTEQEPVLTIRPYCSEDRGAVRAICLKTAFRNRGYDYLFEDGELFADYWTDYYLDYEPDLCFVAELDGRVVGYLLGSADYKRFERTMKYKILPPILFKLLWRTLAFRYRQKKTYRYIKWVLTRSWREMPPVPHDRYPAHYHSNLLRQAAFQRGFSRLLFRFLDALAARGVTGMYGVVLEPQKGGWMSRLIDKARARHVGEEEFFEEHPTRILRDVLNDDTPMVNRVYGCSLETYRDFIEYAGKFFKL